MTAWPPGEACLHAHVCYIISMLTTWFSCMTGQDLQVEELLLGSASSAVTIVSGQIADPYVLLRLSNGQVRLCAAVCVCAR